MGTFWIASNSDEEMVVNNENNKGDMWLTMKYKLYIHDGEDNGSCDKTLGQKECCSQQW